MWNYKKIDNYQFSMSRYGNMYVETFWQIEIENGIKHQNVNLKNTVFFIN